MSHLAVIAVVLVAVIIAAGVILWALGPPAPPDDLGGPGQDSAL